MATCNSCESLLDQHGRCAECMGVTPEQLEARKYQLVYWTVCDRHGVHEATGRAAKLGRVWSWRCPACMKAQDWDNSDRAVTVKERIERRREYWEAENAELLAAFEAQKAPRAGKEKS